MELVVLVDEKNNEIGTRPKSEVHTTTTPLHRGFSLFLFNTSQQLLITRRAHTKKTFPGVWTNSVCGHPGPQETVVDAAKRRLLDELGVSGVEIKEVAPYRYRFEDIHGIVENEICPILMTICDAKPKINSKEVADWKWVAWSEFLREIKQNPKSYSPWCIEEAVIIEQLHQFNG